MLIVANYKEKQLRNAWCGVICVQCYCHRLLWKWWFIVRTKRNFMSSRYSTNVRCKLNALIRNVLEWFQRRIYINVRKLLWILIADIWHIKYHITVDQHTKASIWGMQWIYMGRIYQCLNVGVQPRSLIQNSCNETFSPPPPSPPPPGYFC